VIWIQRCASRKSNTKRRLLVKNADSQSYGIVTLGGKESFWFVIIACPGVASGRRDCPPDLGGSRSQEPVIRRSQQWRPTRKRFWTTAWRERNRWAWPADLNRRICRSLWRVGGRLMRGFGAIVGVAFCVVSHIA
jgi:hypothetical protein